MAKKSKAKKAAKKKAAKKRVKQRNMMPVSHEIVVRVQPQEMQVVPTITDLAEPMKDGKKLTVPKTWMSDKQITWMVQKTPREHVYQRKAKGGGMWDYVTGSYVEKVLNFVFGWNWDFEVTSHGKEGDHIWVLGKLTVRSPDGKQSITKTQFGRAEIKYKTESKKEGNKWVRHALPHKPENMLDYGNDLKAATTDALKKAASLLGIASDIYGKADYKEETGSEPRNTAEVQALPPAPPAKREDIYCDGARKSGCPEGKEITPQEAEYSKRIYGRKLCRDCIKDATPLK